MRDNGVENVGEDSITITIAECQIRYKKFIGKPRRATLVNSDGYVSWMSIAPPLCPLERLDAD